VKAQARKGFSTILGAVAAMLLGAAVRTPRYGTPNPAAGVPVKASFLRSMMDNVERSAGIGNRFGIAYVGRPPGPVPR
jgi:hypothetical protein